MIKEAQRLSNIHTPWDERKRQEILKNPRLENAFTSLGCEYLFKGIFLAKGYAINKIKQPVPNGLVHPLKLSQNKSKLDPTEVVMLGYIKDHLPSLIDFTDFDNKQSTDEIAAKKKEKGQKLDGITRMTTPYPNSKQLLDYLLVKRNYSLHRPFIIPEFKGITNHVFNFLEYIAQKGTGKTIDELAVLTDEL